MPKQKILITVKTYPSISTKYEELVCTAGFTESGDWIRLYPIPFRKLDYANQYKKYDWIEIDIDKNTSDFRPESYKPVNIDLPLVTISHLDTANNWEERKKIVLKNVHIDLDLLIKEAKEKHTSLAVFRPTKIIDFITENVAEREWSKEKLAFLLQGNLFETTKNKLEVVRKLPYKFSFKFEDINGKQSTLMNEDWELGALYWRQLAKYDGDEKRACEDVRKKYFDDFAKTKDLYFFLGTTKLHHLRAPNPFIIIGTFHPKKEVDKPVSHQQLELF
jgi:hypothetical protein